MALFYRVDRLQSAVPNGLIRTRPASALGEYLWVMLPNDLNRHVWPGTLAKSSLAWRHWHSSPKDEADTLRLANGFCIVVALLSYHHGSPPFITCLWLRVLSFYFVLLHRKRSTAAV